MLVIERGYNQCFTVHTPDGDVTVRVAGIRDGRVLLGIEAPKEWAIHRDDIKDKQRPAGGQPSVEVEPLRGSKGL